MEEMTRRELAFCYIYSQEIQKENSKAQVKLFLDSTEVEDGRTREYVKNVASGIKEHGEEITEKIAKNLKTGWTIERISKVDVSLLKLAIYEMNYMQTPFKIIINEVVNMAKKYGEDSSPAFVNGVLAKIVEENNKNHNSGKLKIKEANHSSNSNIIQKTINLPTLKTSFKRLRNSP